MPTLHVKVVGLKNHPVKRNPLPFIYAACKLSDNDNFEQTAKSNSLPPFWDHCFHFDINTTENVSLDVALVESRLFLIDEELGRISIKLSALPMNYVVTEWIKIDSEREFVNAMYLLMIFHLSYSDDQPFEALSGDFNEQYPWEPIPVTKEDLAMVKFTDTSLPTSAPIDQNSYIPEIHIFTPEEFPPFKKRDAVQQKIESAQ